MRGAVGSSARKQSRGWEMEFWLGLMLGGLVGLAFDLWKRPLDRLLDRRLEHKSTLRSRQLALAAQHDRQYLRNYLTEVILQTTLVGALVGILAGIAFAISNSLSWAFGSDHRGLFIGLSVLGQGLSIVGAVYIVRMAGDALSLARSVNPTPSSEPAAEAPAAAAPEPRR